MNRAVVIGIVNSYIPYRENLVNLQTKEIVEVRSENSGLALANPTDFLEKQLKLNIREYSQLLNIGGNVGVGINANLNLSNFLVDVYSFN